MKQRQIIYYDIIQESVNIVEDHTKNIQIYFDFICFSDENENVQS
jgi:hypothetical protein